MTVFDHPLFTWEPDWQSQRAHPVLRFADAVLRGVAQVWLVDSAVAGALFLAAVAASDPAWCLATIVATASGTLASHALGLPAGPRAAGLHGYNACLSGIALAVFHWGSGGPDRPRDWLLLAPLVAVGALATVLTVAVGAALRRSGTGLTPLTLPFQLAAWAWLLQAHHSPYFPAHHAIQPMLVTPTTHPGLDATLDATLAGSAWTPPGGAAREAAAAVLRGLGQVYLLPAAASGALVLAGLLRASRLGCLLAVAGSAAGLATAAALGLPASPRWGPAVYAGLYGYNGALTALCVGGLVFVPQGTRVVVLALLAAVAASLFTGAAAAFLAPAGLPPLTFPFVAATWAFQLLGGEADAGWFVPVASADMATPERNRARWLAQRERASTAREVEGEAAAVMKPAALLKQRVVVVV